MDLDKNLSSYFLKDQASRLVLDLVAFFFLSFPNKFFVR